METRQCEVLSQAEIDALLTAISNGESGPPREKDERQRRLKTLQNAVCFLPVLFFPDFQRTIAHWDAEIAAELFPTRLPLACIAVLSDRVIQGLLQGFDNAWIALALQNATPDIHQAVMRNVSTRRHTDISAELARLNNKPDPLMGGWAVDELLGPLRKAFLDGILHARSLETADAISSDTLNKSDETPL